MSNSRKLLINCIIFSLLNFAYGRDNIIKQKDPDFQNLNNGSEQFTQYKLLETNTMKGSFTNDGRLAFWTDEWEEYIGISWPKKNNSILVFDHGLWLFGLRNDTLIGAAPMFEPNYTPGPIIENIAAIIEAPEDSALYRNYKITLSSGPGDLDYDQWPIQWGAPTNPDGSPKLFGDIMLWTVYNDAHPDIHGWLEKHKEVSLYNTNIEIRETIWGFNRSGSKGDALFFKWQIYNKGKATLDSVVISHWNDIDIVSSTSNKPAYDIEQDFGYIYFDGTDITDYKAPLAASYFMLQGPIVSSLGSTANAFDHLLNDFKNLPITAFWGIGDDGCMHSILGGSPQSIRHAYNFAKGLRHDGSPIINPVSGDTTKFTFTGNPITREGWVYEGCMGGMAGYMVSSGPFTMAPGDSQEVIFALVGATGDSLEDAIKNLYLKVDDIRTYAGKSLSIKSEKSDIASNFHLYQNYPNPFNPVTTIRFELPEDAFVELKIYDLMGREIRTFIEGNAEAGYKNMSWDGKDSYGNPVSSGMYLYRIDARSYESDKEFHQTRKMVLLR